jgi:hypothetical protein
VSLRVFRHEPEQGRALPEGAIDWLVPIRGGNVVSRERVMVTGEELLDAPQDADLQSLIRQVAHLRPTLWRAKPQTRRSASIALRSWPAARLYYLN